MVVLLVLNFSKHLILEFLPHRVRLGMHVLQHRVALWVESNKDWRSSTCGFAFVARGFADCYGCHTQVRVSCEDTAKLC
eukprot:529108-Amphidinium_carterae.1